VQDPCLIGVTSRDASGKPLGWSPQVQGSFVSQLANNMRGKMYRILPKNQLLNRTLTWGKGMIRKRSTSRLTGIGTSFEMQMIAKGLRNGLRSTFDSSGNLWFGDAQKNTREVQDKE
jgi:hypothetical protein